MNPLVFLRPSAPTPEGLPPPALSGVLWVSELIPGVLGGVYKVLTTPSTMFWSVLLVHREDSAVYPSGSVGPLPHTELVIMG